MGARAKDTLEGVQCIGHGLALTLSLTLKAGYFPNSVINIFTFKVPFYNLIKGKNNETFTQFQL